MYFLQEGSDQRTFRDLGIVLGIIVVLFKILSKIIPPSIKYGFIFPLLAVIGSLILFSYANYGSIPYWLAILLTVILGAAGIAGMVLKLRWNARRNHRYEPFGVVVSTELYSEDDLPDDMYYY